MVRHSSVPGNNIQSPTGWHCLDLLSSCRSLFLSFSFLICKKPREDMPAGLSWELNAVTEVKCLIQRSLVNYSHCNYFCSKADFNYKNRSLKTSLPGHWGLGSCLPASSAVRKQRHRKAVKALDNRRKSQMDLQLIHARQIYKEQVWA